MDGAILEGADVAPIAAAVARPTRRSHAALREIHVIEAAPRYKNCVAPKCECGDDAMSRGLQP
jgi:hypothetical protein